MLCQRLHFTTGAHSPPASAHMSSSPSPVAHAQLEEDVKRSTRTGHTYEISSLLLILCGAQSTLLRLRRCSVL